LKTLRRRSSRVPTRAVAWGVTGAGAFLRESVEVIEELSRRGVPVTVYVSRAGEYVLRAYGLQERLERALLRVYPAEVVYESREVPGFFKAARLYHGVYSLVVISPATLNTVSKIVHGLADTLVSTLAMHAIKSNTPLYILPVDLYESKSTIPLLVDRSKCALCEHCYAARACPTGALSPHEYFKVSVAPHLCTRCYACLAECPYSAIKFDVEITVKPAPYYTSIIKRLREVPGVTIIDTPRRVLEIIH
jgi:dihydromethanopterin reductase (acceptor)